MADTKIDARRCGSRVMAGTQKITGPEWQGLIDHYSALYARVNGVPCPWGNKLAFRRLKEVVASGWSADVIKRCMTDLFASEDVNPAAPPELNIPKLACYVHGPLNKFHEPLAVSRAAEGARRVEDSGERLTEEQWAEIRRAREMAKR